MSTVQPLSILIPIGAALGCAIAGGVFFAFSSFVMPGLARLPAPHAVLTMQEINIAAVAPPFMFVLFGSAVLAATATIFAFTARSDGAGWMLAGAIIYVVSVIGVTVIVHVPLNNSLAAVGSTTADFATQWSVYLGSWVPWNHVRAVGGIVAGGAFVVGALRL